MSILNKLDGNRRTDYIFIVILATLSALNYAVFIFPNSFAPAGVDGICTMIQHLLGINIGYFTLVANIPLLVFGFIFLNKKFMMRTAVYVLAFSIASLIFGHIDLSLLYYYTETGTSIVLAPVAAGTVRGILYAITLKLNCSSGGTDIIVALIQIKRPYYNFMNTLFIINTLIASVSYFVFDMKIEPVICGIIYLFITSAVSNNLRLHQNEAVKFEVISPNLEEVYFAISERAKQPATIVDAYGAYSGRSEKMMICVVDKTKVPQLEEIISEFPDTVVFKSLVSSALVLSEIR